MSGESWGHKENPPSLEEAEQEGGGPWFLAAFALQPSNSPSYWMTFPGGHLARKSGKLSSLYTDQIRAKEGLEKAHDEHSNTCKEKNLPLLEVTLTPILYSKNQ